MTIPKPSTSAEWIPMADGSPLRVTWSIFASQVDGFDMQRNILAMPTSVNPNYAPGGM